MHALNKIKLNIVKLINKALPPPSRKIAGLRRTSLVYPPSPGFGDLSLPCFELAKKLNKTATETAEWLVSEIEVDNVVVATKAIGPYLNFTFNKSYLAKSVIEQIQQEGDEYGRNKIGKDERVMIEYSNVNTHKEYHVGHLRNICYGDAVNRILSVNGFVTIPVSYVNDFGIHVAKTLWCYQEFYKSSFATPSIKIMEVKKATEDKGQFLGKVYTRACQELEKNPTVKELVTFLMKKIESRKGAEYKLWQRTRKWNINQFDRIYKELNVKFDYIFYESEFIDKGRKIVENLYAEHFLTKSQGAIIVNLEKYDLGVLLFLRSDGSALYPVADLPLAMEKFKKYKLDKSIYVVDVRQSLYFKQLFKVLELLFTKDTKCPIGQLVSEMPEMVHLGYEFVKLPSGMMSSRTGQVITYEDLREQAMEKAIYETKKRHKNWSAKKVKQVASKIVNGAIKFEMIKVGAGQVIAFDINQALRFDGFTAAYLQYSYARINSISKKSEVRSKKSEVDFKYLTERKEHELVMKLAKYPSVVEQAGVNYDPSEVAKYLFDLAQLFNDYYHSVPVLKSKKQMRDVRLALISAVSRVIANGLGLLGIEVVEEM